MIRNTKHLATLIPDRLNNYLGLARTEKLPIWTANTGPMKMPLTEANVALVWSGDGRRKQDRRGLARYSLLDKRDSSSTAWPLRFSWPHLLALCRHAANFALTGQLAVFP